MDTLLGTITMFGFDFAPRGWAMCHGQLVAIADNNALFALLGTRFGGDGRTTFALPDLRGRVPLGWGDGPGLSSNQLGQKGGFETHTLTVNQMPSHTHGATATTTASLQGMNAAGARANPTGEMLAAHAGAFAPYEDGGAVKFAPEAIAAETDVTVEPAGGSSPVDNRQPYQVVNFCICIQGIFPSRN